MQCTHCFLAYNSCSLPRSQVTCMCRKRFHRSCSGSSSLICTRMSLPAQLHNSIHSGRSSRHRMRLRGQFQQIQQSLCLQKVGDAKSRQQCLGRASFQQEYQTRRPDFALSNARQKTVRSTLLCPETERLCRRSVSLPQGSRHTPATNSLASCHVLLGASHEFQAAHHDVNLGFPLCKCIRAARVVHFGLAHRKVI